MSSEPLNYDTPSPRGGGSPALPAMSFACLLVPIAGLVMRNGPIFLCGGMLMPVAGLALGIAGVAKPCGTGGLVSSSIAIGLNGLALAYFVWLIFVHGLC